MIDYRLTSARIKGAYGVNADVRAKGKTLLKFGRTTNADANVETTVATFQGTVVNETFATTNSIDAIVCDAADTGNVTIEGHYLSGTSMIFATETVALTGLTPASLSRSYFRVNRIFRTAGTLASPAVALTGNVYVYDSTEATGVTSGVPDVATATKCMVVAGKQQSEKCATSISASDYWIVTQVSAAVQKGNVSTVNADIDVYYRKLGGAWLPLGLEISLRSGGASTVTVDLDPSAIIPANSDVKMVAVSNTNDTTVSGFINGHLALVV